MFAIDKLQTLIGSKYQLMHVTKEQTLKCWLDEMRVCVCSAYSFSVEGMGYSRNPFKEAGYLGSCHLVILHFDSASLFFFFFECFTAAGILVVPLLPSPGDIPLPAGLSTHLWFQYLDIIHKNLLFEIWSLYYCVQFSSWSVYLVMNINDFPLCLTTLD